MLFILIKLEIFELNSSEIFSTSFILTIIHVINFAQGKVHTSKSTFSNL